MFNADNVRSWVRFGAPFAFLVFLAYYGGLPKPEMLPAFILGSVVFALGAILVLWTVNALYQGREKETLPLAFESRAQWLTGTALIAAMFVEVFGGVWDEVWHRRYGLPFGEDFFWMPHILIYFSLTVVLVIGLGSWIAVWRAPVKGSLWQRMRANPDRTLLGILGLTLLVVLPADPLWHTIYGEDISSFSLPHVALATAVLLMVLLVGLRLIIRARPVHYFTRVFALLPAVVIAPILLFSEWVGQIPTPGLDAVTAARPLWLPSMLVITATAFLGGLSYGLADRRIWPSFAVLGIGAILRVITLNAFGFPVLIPDYVLMAICLLTVTRAVRVNGHVAQLAIWIVGAVVVCAVTPTLFDLPAFNTSDWVIGIGVSAFAGWIALLLGRNAGAFLIQDSQAAQADSAPLTVSPWLAAFGSAVAAVLVLLLLITPPPV